MKFSLDNGVEIVLVKNVPLSEGEAKIFRKHSRPFHDDEKTIQISTDYPNLFLHLFEWIRTKKIECVEPAAYDPHNHISEWCHMHILAQEFGYEKLAENCVSGYRKRHLVSREEWEPLPAEIGFIYEKPLEQTNALRNVIIDYMVTQVLSWNMAGKSDLFAELITRSSEFASDVFYAIGTHVVGFDVVGVGELKRKACETENCGIHGSWLKEGSEDFSLPDFEPGTEALSPTPEFPITAEELEALHEAEEAEAIAEAEAHKAQLEREEKL